MATISAKIIKNFITAKIISGLDSSLFATINGIETLTNKTLTSPAINTPTGIVKADVGLGNVPNLDFSDASNITTGILSSSVLPPIAITQVYTATSEIAQLALTTQEGDVVVRTDLNKSYIKNTGTTGTMTDFTELQTPTGSVLSVNGKTGTVSLKTTDIPEGTNLYFTNNRVNALLTGLVPYTGATSALDLGVNNLIVNTNQLYVDTVTGNVGIGTVSPAHKLTVAVTNANEGLFITKNGVNMIRFSQNGSTGAGRLDIYASAYDIDTSLVGNGNIYLKKNVGNVGIGTTAPSQKLDVAGKIKATLINLTSLPTSATGLSAGDVWNNSGVLNII